MKIILIMLVIGIIFLLTGVIAVIIDWVQRQNNEKHGFRQRINDSGRSYRKPQRINQSSGLQPINLVGINTQPGKTKGLQTTSRTLQNVPTYEELGRRQLEGKDKDDSELNELNIIVIIDVDIKKITFVSDIRVDYEWLKVARASDLDAIFEFIKKEKTISVNKEDEIITYSDQGHIKATVIVNDKSSLELGKTIISEFVHIQEEDIGIMLNDFNLENQGLLEFLSNMKLCRTLTVRSLSRIIADDIIVRYDLKNSQTIKLLLITPFDFNQRKMRLISSGKSEVVNMLSIMEQLHPGLSFSATSSPYIHATSFEVLALRKEMRKTIVKALELAKTKTTSLFVLCPSMSIFTLLDLQLRYKVIKLARMTEVDKVPCTSVQKAVLKQMEQSNSLAHEDDENVLRDVEGQAILELNILEVLAVIERAEETGVILR